jgi:YcaO-like protein with predicted kinase domain
VLEEAVCHALCEVIEHDAASIAELVASAIPYTILRKMLDSFRDKDYEIMPIPANVYVDDNSVFPDVDILGLDFYPINCLIDRFEKAGVPLLLKDVTSDIGIPTFIATSFEWITHDYAFSAYGQGSHPDARVALIRAITELAQTRTTNSQGSRDDLKKVKYEENNYDQNKKNWKFAESKERVKFSKVNSYVNEDILDDINLLLTHIKKSGLKKAIIVDLTNPNIGIPVVRALVPGLENFDETKSVMGRRAKEHFRRLKRL